MAAALRVIGQRVHSRGFRLLKRQEAPVLVSTVFPSSQKCHRFGSTFTYVPDSASPADGNGSLHIWLGKSGTVLAFSVYFNRNYRFRVKRRRWNDPRRQNESLSKRPKSPKFEWAGAEASHSPLGKFENYTLWKVISCTLRQFWTKIGLE